MWRTLILLCVAAFIRCDEEEWKLIKSGQGPVRGRKDPAGVYIFNNIPYATIPKGPHKFEAPLPPPAWQETRDATEKSIICPQPQNIFIKDNDRVIMEEDCLVANVYTPTIDEKDLPVVVYVHGGAYERGYGDMVTFKNFVKDKNVIVVTFNYRLGVHGFLCLGTSSAPGNAGLKDQVALLHWVRKYIESYGGDPENVTIAGFSAGSISADLLMLSKTTKGLFNKVILESGVGLAAQNDPLENAKKYAKMLNFNNVDDFYALEEFYKSTPLDSLITSTFYDSKDVALIFGACVERKDRSAFLEDAPINIIKSGAYRKVPILLGTSNMEGLLRIQTLGKWKNEINEKFSDFLPAYLHFDNESEKESVAKAVKSFYFGDQAISEETILSFIDYMSDVYFVYPTLKTVSLHAEQGHKDIYLYEYSYVDDNTPTVPYTKVRGASHCAQTFAIADGNGTWLNKDESKILAEYKEMKNTMRELWYNFAVNRKPVPEESSLPSWPSAGVDRSPYMSLGQTVELKGSLHQSRAALWDGIFQKYYRHPIPPPKPPHRNFFTTVLKHPLHDTHVENVHKVSGGHFLFQK